MIELVAGSQAIVICLLFVDLLYAQLLYGVVPGSALSLLFS